MTAHVWPAHGETLTVVLEPKDEEITLLVCGKEPFAVVHTDRTFELTSQRLPCDRPHAMSPWWVHVGLGYSAGAVTLAIALVLFR